jgi:hypothetical protein
MAGADMYLLRYAGQHVLATSALDSLIPFLCHDSEQVKRTHPQDADHVH